MADTSQMANQTRKEVCVRIYYFQFDPAKGRFAFQIAGESPRRYPLSYTYKECVEDWCDRKGYEFRQLTDQNGTYRGSGHFEHYRC